MSQHKVGILHPGQMGASIAAAAKESGQDVYWASAGRSDATRERAEKAGLTEVGTLQELCDACDTILSVCPPAAAEDVAKQVVDLGFRGNYLDGNAISPQRARRIDAMMREAGVVFVDGSIVGPPAWETGSTWLYLSGARAAEMAALFDGGPLNTIVMGDVVGQASALKMCYAAFTKGSTALLAAVQATAAQNGVADALREQWRMDGRGLDERAPDQTRRVTAKAWRFVGEMDEIAATFEDAGLPGGFHQAAAIVYRRMAGFKDAAETPSLHEVVEALINDESN